MNISTTLRRAVIAVAALGAGFGTAAVAGVVLPPPPPSTTIESWSSCTQFLCIDAPPQGPQGLDGSGGWGWNSSANAPVTSLTVGKPATFTVTVLQPDPPPCTDEGSITLTYSSQDFSLSPTSGAGKTATNPFDRGGVATFSYSVDDLCHTDKSDSFTFTPQNPTGTALVTATVNVGGEQVSETFPVAILRKH